jgi:hypothetical protein
MGGATVETVLLILVFVLASAALALIVMACAEVSEADEVRGRDEVAADAELLR